MYILETIISTEWFACSKVNPNPNLTQSTHLKVNTHRHSMLCYI